MGRINRWRSTIAYVILAVGIALADLAQMGRANLFWIRFRTPVDVCLGRNTARGDRAVPDSVMTNMVEQLDQVDWDALPGTVIDASEVMRGF